MYYGNSFNCGRIRTGRAVLVAISIPIFTSQLEKSRDAVTVSNMRAAYAEASSAMLTANGKAVAKDGNVTVAAADTDGKVEVTVEEVVAKGTADGFAGNIDAELPFTHTSAANMGKAKADGSNYTMVFAFAKDGTCTATAN